MMRILLILIFILVANTVSAKTTKYKCKGFCKGEKYDYKHWPVKDKIDVVIKGKKKKLDIIKVYKGFTVKNSLCSPFIGIIESFAEKNEK